MKGFPISLAHTTPITLVLWLFYLSLLVIPIVKIPVWKKTVCLYSGGGHCVLKWVLREHFLGITMAK